MSLTYEHDSIFYAYLKWHYGKGLSELLGVTKNFLWFVTHFFSFKLLIKTLFAPWRRLGESYTGGFNLEAFASTLVVNNLMRIVGFVTRIFVLSLGVAFYLFVLSLAILISIIWFLAPAVLLGSLVLSVTFFMV